MRGGSSKQGTTGVANSPTLHPLQPLSVSSLHGPLSQRARFTTSVRSTLSSSHLTSTTRHHDHHIIHWQLKSICFQDHKGDCS
jgi:hypothetical protein